MSRRLGISSAGRDKVVFTGGSNVPPGSPSNSCVRSISRGLDHHSTNLNKSSPIALLVVACTARSMREYFQYGGGVVDRPFGEIRSGQPSSHFSQAILTDGRAKGGSCGRFEVNPMIPGSRDFPLSVGFRSIGWGGSFEGNDDLCFATIRVPTVGESYEIQY